MSAFNLMDRLGFDNSQRNESNTKFANYVLDNQFSSTDDHVKFATQAPTINFRATLGGLPPSAVDFDSMLLIKTEQQRAYEKLQLVQRPFLTVPYLGKGSSDPALESRLQQGEWTNGKTPSMGENIDYPMLANVKDRVSNPAFSVEEVAMNGWIRGGKTSREQTQFSNE
jgi:hypothetical protein